MSEIDLKDLESISRSHELMDILIDKGIIKEKKFIRWLKYAKELEELQLQMLRLQSFVIEKGLRPIFIFEGRDAAGKGGTIKRIISSLNPKKYKVIAQSKPTDLEREQWYFQRHIQFFPPKGEMRFLDRSWYNRAVVEPVFGFCSDEQHEHFLSQVLNFEHQLIDEGFLVFKFFLSISKDEQADRLEKRKNDPLKQFKIGGLDKQAQDKWDDYEHYIQKMFDQCSSKKSPWIEIKTDSKKDARLNVMRYLLSNFPEFESENKSPDSSIINLHKG